MSSSPSLRWVDRSNFRFDRQDPYLRIQSFTVFVRDQDQSLRFYRDQLGFQVVQESRFGTGGRWIAVAPADGTAVLAIATPSRDSEEYERIGRSREVVFLTDDVIAHFQDWSKRGVRFHHPPVTPDWGGTFTSFEDPDGNRFALVGFDAVSREIEAQRRGSPCARPSSWQVNLWRARNASDLPSSRVRTQTCYAQAGIMLSRCGPQRASPCSRMRDKLSATSFYVRSRCLHENA